ncbi:MAG TPA: GDSL-type esterase/lipase family protein [Candidatus Limnocylindrales bacterium]|nr:GDSL-type esterase/lipase family protein [Candidatus Limnocylindrales bacterium]
MNSSRIGRLSGALVLASASVVGSVAILLLLEFVAGLLLPPAQKSSGDSSGDTISQTLATLDFNPAPLRADPELLWSNTPSTHTVRPVNPRPFGQAPTWTIDNNSRGFRGPEIAAKAKGTYRILCEGDSITFGFNVDQPDTYPNQLLAELKRRYPGRNFEVINTGVPGWSWVQGRRFLELRGLPLDPDLVIMGHGSNDQFFPAMITDEERFRSLGSPVWRTLRSAAETLADTNLFRLLGTAPGAPPKTYSPGCQPELELYHYCHRVSVRQIEDTVVAIHALVHEHGSDLLLLNTDFMKTPAVDGSRKAAEAAAIPFLDLVAEIDRQTRAADDARANELGLSATVAAPLPGTRLPTESKRMTLRLKVQDRTQPYRVEGNIVVFANFPVRAPLHDDGADGDEKAGDGVFSGSVEIPYSTPAIEYSYYQNDAAEFLPLPPLPSTMGVRLLPTPQSGYGPVDVFGTSQFMAERTHPNAAGHAIVARMIVDRLREMPSFRAYVDMER